MHRISTLFSLLVLVMVALSCQPKKENNPTQPNILLILSDDLGIGDLESYNPQSLVPTPNLNKLAEGGISLTNAYCPASVCSPTRYSLMTGNYPFRSWKKKGVMANYEPSMIGKGLVTLPQMLKGAGYATAGFGKWHLGTTFQTLDGKEAVGYGKFYDENNGANLDLQKPVTDGPLDYGFDRWLGFSCASECWVFDDDKIFGALGHEKYTIEAAPNRDHIKSIPLKDYLPYITSQSIEFLKGRRKDKPFFLYYAPYVPHIPLTVSDEFIGSTEAGLYGDYVHELDHYIGNVLNALDSLGLSENTIVLFASDNGSQFKVTNREMDLKNAGNSPSDSLKEMYNENTHRPNGLYRGTKWTAWEGGVRTPFIARWPGKFPAGQKSDQMMVLNDVIRTMATIVGAELPQGSALDSYDISSILKGERKAIREEVIVRQVAIELAFDGATGSIYAQWISIKIPLIFQSRNFSI